MNTEYHNTMKNFYLTEMFPAIWYPINQNLSPRAVDALTALVESCQIHGCIFNANKSKVMKVDIENQIDKILLWVQNKMTFEKWYNVVSIESLEVMKFIMLYFDNSIEFNSDYSKVRKVDLNGFGLLKIEGWNH